MCCSKLILCVCHQLRSVTADEEEKQDEEKDFVDETFPRHDSTDSSDSEQDGN